MPPAVQAVGRQLATTGGWIQPPHAHSLPFQPGIPSSQVCKLWDGSLALSTDQVVGLPELHLGGGPGCIGVPPVTTLLRELRELPRVKSDSSWDRAKAVPLWRYWGLPAPPCGRSWSWGLGSCFKPSSLPGVRGQALGACWSSWQVAGKGGNLKIQLPSAEASSTLWRMPG